MIQITINHQVYEVEEGITIMEAARRNDIDIPNLCYLKNVHQLGACRICVVEVKGQPNLAAACMTKVKGGMVINTYSNRVNKARKLLYELMLSDHSQDCLSCARNQSCEFQALGKQLGVDTSRFTGERSQHRTDMSVSIERDLSKCILCRRCVSACGGIQQASVIGPQNRGFATEVSPAMSLPLGTSNCAYCGQCTVVCPVGALRETSAKRKVWNALEDPELRTVVQVAPAVRVALGEEFHMHTGARVTGKMVSALRKLGFRDVFDTNFAADLTIMEEGTELLERLKAALTGEKIALPMITSCSPGWIKYCEHHFPGQLGNLSSCKSPHTMLGALVKSYYAEKLGIKPEKIFVVSVMPCTAKKFEISREEMKNHGVPNVDAVLTTRELAEMIRSAGIRFTHLDDGEFDNPLGLSSGAADIFGLTGGVMEAALRTVYELVTGRELPFEKLHVTPIVGLEQVKQAELTIENPLPEYEKLAGVTMKVAVTSGLAGAEKLMRELKDGKSPYHFIEVMGCPGGCIMGGGQPRSEKSNVREKRLEALYAEDESKEIRKSHENPYVTELYKNYLGKPGGHLSHDLLHTHYVPRPLWGDLVELTTPAPRSSQMDGPQALPKRTKPQKSNRSEDATPKVMELETENKRLKSELKDAQESIEILKSVLSNYH